MRSAALSTLVVLLASTAASAQSPPSERSDSDSSAVETPRLSTLPNTNTWITGWLGGFTDPGSVSVGGEHRDFGSTMAGGLGIHRTLGSALSVGIDASLAPSVRYEIRPEDGGAVDRSGTGRLGTAFATGRLRTGGFDALTMYLTGGAGAFLYKLDEGWEPDLALLAGAGLEYQLTPARALFLEWGRYTVFHGGDGVGSNRAKHSQLRIGGRFGL